MVAENLKNHSIMLEMRIQKFFALLITSLTLDSCNSG